MPWTIMILLAGFALVGCATPPEETFAAPPGPDRPAAATDFGVDIPTAATPEAEGPQPRPK